MVGIGNRETAEFNVGEEYVRRELHDMLGGQRYGGISTPKRFPEVLIFTGDAGQQHVYGFDGWRGKSVFHYTGEGQPERGDMRFSAGNRAIRDHIGDGKRLLLFEQVRKRSGRVKFVGEMVYRGHHIEQRDTAGYSREVIVFEPEPLDDATHQRVVIASID
jgi:5-methylcytosine-specific restriction protein A